MNCPHCHTKLKPTLGKSGYVHVCGTCDGRAVALPVIRNLVSENVARELWKSAITSGAPSAIACPACNHHMTTVSLANDGSSAAFDLCQTCHFVWFDPREFETLPQTQPLAPPKKELPLEARKVIALAKLEALKDEQQAQEFGNQSPDHWWELILAFLGMPVEYNYEAVKKTPMATYTLAFAMALAVIVSWPYLNEIIQEWGLVPNQLTRHFGLTFVSGFLLHGGIVHLLGNLYFLVTFGDNVEDVLGIKHFLLLIVLATLVGDCAHILADPRAITPVVGASGGISGVLAFYCLRFPKARIGIIFWFRWFRIPVGLMLFLWFIGQLVGAYKQIAGFSHVSSLAHLGGAFVGLVYWWFTRRAPQTRQAGIVTP